MQVKKVFEGLITLLQENEDKKVKTILPQILELARAKRRSNEGETYIKNADGAVVAILCSYYSKWMPTVGDKAVEFGKRVGTATGLNSMCKDGLNLYAEQKRIAVEATNKLMQDLRSKAVSQDNMDSILSGIEIKKELREPTDKGFADRSELETYLESCGIVLNKDTEEVVA